MALAVAAALLSADTKLGSVQSFSGTVTIDAFGKGAFIAVVKGDVLYALSVLRTGAPGRARIELNGQILEIPPVATVKISDLISAGGRKGGLGWFAAVGKMLKSFSAASRENDTDRVLGSRAENKSQAEEPEWEVEETDPLTILPDARKSIESGSYSSALEKLARAETPSNPSVSWDLSFWKGYCYYQLEDFGDAAAHLAAAYALSRSSKTATGSPGNRETLLFQLGSSYYLLGREKDAVPVLDAYRAENLDGQYAPYADLLLARSLASAGEAGRSRSIAADAVKKYKGSDLESEFASLAR
jgi:tetratricopeptide (TPR) repeat protein